MTSQATGVVAQEAQPVPAGAAIGAADDELAEKLRLLARNDPAQLQEVVAKLVNALNQATGGALPAPAAVSREPVDPAAASRGPVDPAAASREPADPAVASRGPVDPAAASREPADPAGVPGCDPGGDSTG